MTEVSRTPSPRPARPIPSPEWIKKHGYYYNVLGPEEKELYLDVLANPGFETEIAILRQLIHSAAAGGPEEASKLPRLSKLLASFLRFDEEIKKGPAKD